MTMASGPLADARDMFAVHTMFRREYGSMPDLVRAVAAGDKQRAAVVADHIALMNTILNLHHSGEDKHIWPRLHERVPAEIAPIVTVMEGQHEAIHERYLQVTEALGQWRDSASAETRDALADGVDQLIQLLREHLALEEERVVPLIETYITADEYRLLSTEGGADTPPEQLPVIFGMIMYEGVPEVIENIIAEMPAEVQPVIKDLAPKAYAAYAEKVYGTSTPPGVSAAVWRSDSGGTRSAG
jgi:hemerythrin-like domain-containing protein